MAADGITPNEMTSLTDRHSVPYRSSSRKHWFEEERRQLLLLLTEPESSWGASFFFVILIALITFSNVLMVIQTMDSWQFVPTDCVTCGGNVSYMFEDDDQVEMVTVGFCMCPPAPLPITETFVRYIMFFFTVEWILRVVCFTSDPNETKSHIRQLYDYITSMSMMLDFWACFPYYLESINIQSLVSLRLLRLLRVFMLLRLGMYNSMMKTLTNVLTKAVEYLKLLVLFLIFGGVLFGSVVYWVERGHWKYFEPADSYQFVRTAVDGVTEEISPFRSIPKAMWWFVVTATTVGYGDTYPTSTAGQCCAALAMLTGVLVIAFPVSIFSDLWHEEMKNKHGGKDSFDDDGNDWNQTMAPASNDSSKVVMDKKDLKAIAECFRVIREKEDRLSTILSKYNMDGEMKEIL
ncbi:unnamed protein product [Cylindrotheca closterium]|uniref:Ion transport domain-containing protein n=1 Tax=Cylindrotheca closterium TaxID=2856 RepID=A0AAD2FQ92_9STRA|nr:unnamed protein product [Cylindrotheca closterium]